MKKIFLVFFLLVSCNSPKEDQGTVLVKVGNGVLTMEKLDIDIPNRIKHHVSQEQINNYIQQWLETELIYQEALRTGMNENDDYKSELEKTQREILVRIFLSNYFKDEPNVSEEEARQYYEENKDNFKLVNDEVKLLQILVDTIGEADEARKRIRSGEDFIEVAKEVSIDYIKNQRIDLGYLTKENIIPEIANIAFSNRIAIGSVPRPIKSDFGYHVIQIEDRRKKDTIQEFDEVKDIIISRLKFIKQNERYRDLIFDLRNRINIQKNIDLLQRFYSDTTLFNNNQEIESDMQ